jgi:hypothetical protein
MSREGASRQHYTYDRRRTNIDISLQYYPGLTDWGRQRIQLDAGAKREVWRDVFLSIIGSIRSTAGRPLRAPTPTMSASSCRLDGVTSRGKPRISRDVCFS